MIGGAKILNNQDPITKDYLAKIGEIVVLLSHLEFWVEFWIWELIDASGATAHKKQEIGRRITAPLEFMEKADLLRSLVLERLGEEKAKEYKEIHKVLEECCSIRNDVAHSVWFFQFGNLSEGISPSTHKINVKKVLKANKSFDFAKAYADVLVEELQEYPEKINLVIAKLGFFF